MRNTRLSGHDLRFEGRGVDPVTRVLHNGAGHARCECGQWSPVLPTTAARKRWHRDEHKPAMRAKEET